MSKSVHSPYWAEQFDLHLYADQSKVLEITLCGANQSASDFIEKSCIDLSELPSEKSHKITQQFGSAEQGSRPCIELLVTITGSQSQGAPSIASNFNCAMTKSKTYSDICRKYVRQFSHICFGIYSTAFSRHRMPSIVYRIFPILVI